MRFRLASMKKAWMLVGVAAAAALLVLGGCTASRISAAAQLARESEPFQHNPPNAALRLLIVGDSTGVGTGARAPKHSVAGLLAQAFPRLAIDNLAQDGAHFEGGVQQLQGETGRFDVVLIQAGGNDVVRRRSDDKVRDDIERAIALATQRSDHVLVMPAGNVGNAPFFFAPVSLLMTSRAKRMHGYVKAAAQQYGAVYVNIFKDEANDPFANNPGLHASDGLHPSDAGYRIWFDELTRQGNLATLLASAR